METEVRISRIRGDEVREYIYNCYSTAPMTRASEKVLMAHWFLYCLIMVTAFTSNNLSNLISPMYYQDISDPIAAYTSVDFNMFMDTNFLSGVFRYIEKRMKPKLV